jgi:murein DD-endopeptidase MepM/ murein hydrolase activator NlpD
MAYLFELPCSRLGLRVSLLTLIAVGFAGCSSDVTRFDSNPFASRGAPASSEVTGSIPRGPAAPTGRVESRPLPQTSALPAPPPTHVSSTGVSTGAGGMGSYRPPTQQGDVTGSIAPHQVAAAAPAPLRAPVPQYAAPAPAPQRAPAPQYASAAPANGQVVIVAPGETLFSISRRHGVSVSTLMQANNITSPNELRPGQRLVVPGQHTARVAPAPAPARPVAAPPVHEARTASAPATVPAAPSYGGFHVAGPGDTLSKIAHRYRVSLNDLAKANHLAPYAQIKLGDRLVIPSHVSAAVPPRPAPVQQQTASIAPAAPAAAAPVANLAKATETPPEAEPEHASSAMFRWPARGRIITAFGAKPNGQQNDGINIAVPEGTPIKAAESGEVAYAGNELKGYGNLILIRHPNGFVTAYAHASELLVKRGDKVKRGQVIAKSGQTGNIGSPQLHFEIRKGSTPVDPTPYLGA